MWPKVLRVKKAKNHFDVVTSAQPGLAPPSRSLHPKPRYHARTTALPPERAPNRPPALEPAPNRPPVLATKPRQRVPRSNVLPAHTVI